MTEKKLTRKRAAARAEILGSLPTMSTAKLRKILRGVTYPWAKKRAYGEMMKRWTLRGAL